MKWNEKVDGYSAALILSEGRYEIRERQCELPEIKIEEVKKSNWLRISDRVVKRIATLEPLKED